MEDTYQQIFEFRGVDKFYFAEVTQDDANGYVCGTPIHIPVQEVGKATDSASEAHYYDNKAMIVVNSESADTITLTLAPPALDELAKLIGKSFDATTQRSIATVKFANVVPVREIVPFHSCKKPPSHLFRR